MSYHRMYSPMNYEGEVSRHMSNRRSVTVKGAVSEVQPPLPIGGRVFELGSTIIA